MSKLLDREYEAEQIRTACRKALFEELSQTVSEPSPVKVSNPSPVQARPSTPIQPQTPETNPGLGKQWFSAAVILAGVVMIFSIVLPIKESAMHSTSSPNLSFRSASLTSLHQANEATSEITQQLIELRQALSTARNHVSQLKASVAQQRYTLENSLERLRLAKAELNGSNIIVNAIESSRTRRLQ